jgi:hypothetical protein
MKKPPNERVIRDLHRWTDIPEEELRSLTAQQADNIVEALQDGRRGILTVDEVTDRLTDNGLFDLPSKREEQRRYIEELQLAEVRALADLHNAQCLQRGEPENMVRLAKEEGREYPPARSN